MYLATKIAIMYTDYDRVKIKIRQNCQGMWGCLMDMYTISTAHFGKETNLVSNVCTKLTLLAIIICRWTKYRSHINPLSNWCRHLTHLTVDKNAYLWSWRYFDSYQLRFYKYECSADVTISSQADIVTAQLHRHRTIRGQNAIPQNDK